jgi:hypothetical protein
MTIANSAGFLTILFICYIIFRVFKNGSYHIKAVNEETNELDVFETEIS